MATLAVIGSGYVGLTTAACFAHLGHRVSATDHDPDRLVRLRRGEIPILEPQLAELVAEGTRSGALSFSADNVAAAATSEFVFICVPTPPRADGGVDTTAVEQLAAEIAPVLSSGAVVVAKSTCPPGFAARLARLLSRPDVPVVMNPEFLREGTAVADFLAPDRVVAGSDDEGAARRVLGLYDGVSGARMVMDAASAELVKYASNAFLATKVTFANSLATMSEAFGADVRAVAAGVGADHRIGPHFLEPGPGYGGSCLPKDTRALASAARERGVPFRLLEEVIAVDEMHRAVVVDKVLDAVSGSLSERRIALWGLTFKAGTDDTRASPALDIARRLGDLGAEVRGYDPALTGVDRIGPVRVLSDRYSACVGASVLVVATEWDEFARSNWSKVAELMESRAVVDARNVLEPDDLVAHGFSYRGLGVRPRAA